MTSIIHTYFSRILLGYGYDSLAEFFFSLCPSFKYNLQVPTIAISSIIAVMCHYLGMTPFVVIGMAVAVLVETLTGIGASHKRGEPFESFRFSRCIIKVFIWMSLVFMVNCFCLECEYNEGWMYDIGEIFFDIIKLLILAYFLVEYIVSIMENFAVLDGKEKTEFVNAVHGMWQSLIENLKRNANN